MDDYHGLNANMHTVEAFLSAADVTGDEKYRVRAGRIISRVIPWAAGNHWRLPEHYTPKWEPDYEFNYYRDINVFLFRMVETPTHRKGDWCPVDLRRRDHRNNVGGIHVAHGFKLYIQLCSDCLGGNNGIRHVAIAVRF